MAQDRKKTVLFLCTGNYYRSRYAECLFNSVADEIQGDQRDRLVTELESMGFRVKWVGG